MKQNYPVFSILKLLIKNENETVQGTLGHPFMTNNFNECISIWVKIVHVYIFFYFMHPFIITLQTHFFVVDDIV